MRRNPGKATWQTTRGKWKRACCACGVVKDLDAFPKRGANSYHYRCKPCKREYENKLRADQRNTPAFKAKAARDWALWKERHPDRNKARHKRQFQQRRSDPARWTRHLEDKRMAHRLKREREGKSVRPPLEEAKRCISKESYLPAAPLYLVAKRYVERRAEEHETIDEACKSLGVTGREYRRWVNGEHKQVRFLTADKILTSLGLHWWDVWDESEVPEVVSGLSCLTG